MSLSKKSCPPESELIPPPKRSSLQQARALTDVLRQAEALMYYSGNVLIVLDIDNTLLVSDQHLGSEQWVDAMVSSLLILRKPDTQELFMRRAQQLLDITYDSIVKTIAATGKYHLIEDSLDQQIMKLQDMGAKIIALTARSPSVMEATIKSLQNNKIDFDRSKLGQDILEFKIPGMRYSAAYQKGVFLTRGGDKGKLLMAMIREQGQIPDVVLFVDNKQKEVDSVYSAFTDAEIDIIAYRYNGLDDKTEAYHKQDQPIARVQLKVWAESGLILSNDEAEAVVNQDTKRNPVSEREANKLIYGTENPLLP